MVKIDGTLVAKLISHKQVTALFWYTDIKVLSDGWSALGYVYNSSLKSAVEEIIVQYPAFQLQFIAVSSRVTHSVAVIHCALESLTIYCWDSLYVIQRGLEILFSFIISSCW